MEKGKAFKWTVQAFDSAGAGTTGIGGSITAELRTDNATSGTATTDVNPTEISGGYYDFSITSSEANVTNCMTLFPATTAATHIIATPKMLDFWPSNFSLLSISTAGNANTDVKLIEASDPTDQINAACDTALSDIHLDHLLAVDYDPASKPGTATALLNELVESDAGVSRFTVNALENGPSGTGASAETIADAVWDEAISGHVAAGSFGAKNQNLVPSETIGDYKADVSGLATTTELNKVPKSDGTSTWNATALASINAECDTALSDYDAPTKAELDSAFTEIKGATWSSLTDTLEGIRDKQTDIEADTNELQTNQGNWLTATGFATSSQAGTIQADLDIITGVDGVTLASVQGNYAPNTVVPDPAGTAPTAAEIRTEMDSNSTKLSSIETDTQDIQTQIGTAGAGLTAVPWNAAWDAEVQSEVADALDAAIPATPTAKSINDYVMRMKYTICNKLEVDEATGGSTIYDDAGSSFSAVAAAFTTLAGVTTRKKLI